MTENSKFLETQKQYWKRDSLEKRRDANHPVVLDYVLPKISQIRKTVSITSSTRLLDVGCGNGFFTCHFDKICDTTGIDFSEKMIALNPVLKKRVMNAHQLEFDDDSFDVVFCHALLHHVDNIDKVIREMKRTSRKWVVILEPNRNNPLMFLFSAIVKEERKALHFSLSYLQRLARNNGLFIEDAFSFGMLVPNKTPTFLLPLIKRFNFPFAFGITNFLIAKKV
ncbi:MAG: methyltransferase domain-containing protein [Chitinispirillaceae bacterium]|nr:methyltransferase domain-containing protein [Chitinispirillaceae bacterium]